ncbi:MFS transporter [Kocuria sp. p3-SID1433]|uniref:MFS transporter n=1 Tax=unclassified Kocuria TaxID=2649579 RepID=UPI0021A8BAD9|nr:MULTISPECIES: MFS transporter [unclassified Kocuria]MCT1602031.1 MFS transporter [Kocuria sp. p3-SID1428]MCT2180630.1 MFS transporter [Kocuria sp. p3-SID1433]
MSTVQTATQEQGTQRSAWIGLAALMLPVLTVAVTTTTLSFALPDIAADLRPTGTQLLWVVDIYPLILAGLLIPMGTVGDHIGRRRLLMIGAVGFALSSAAGGLSTSPEMLIASRVAVAVFGSMLLPATLSLIRVLFPSDDSRRIAIAVWTAGFSAGAALGPLIGGGLLTWFSWHAAILAPVPFCLLFAVLAPIVLPESRDPNPGKLDLVSAALAILTMTPIVYGIKTAATAGSVLTAAVALLVGLAFGTLFVLRQRRLSHPMLELGLFRSGRFSGGVLVNIASNLAQFGFLFFLTQHLQLVVGMDSFTAGLMIIPGMSLAIVSGLVGARWAGTAGPRTVVVTGVLLIAAGYAVLAVFANDSWWPLTLGYAVLSLGLGFSTTLSTELVVGSVPPEKSGSASAISETGYELGSVLGTSLVGGIVTGLYQRFLLIPEDLDPDSAQAARETLGGAYAVGGQSADGQQLIDAAGLAYTQAIQMTGIVSTIALIAFAMLALRLLRSPSFTATVDARTGQMSIVPPASTDPED